MLKIQHTILFKNRSILIYNFIFNMKYLDQDKRLTFPNSQTAKSD